MKRYHADFFGLNIDLAIGARPGAMLHHRPIQFIHCVKESLPFVLTLGSISLITVTWLVLVVTAVVRANASGMISAY